MRRVALVVLGTGLAVLAAGCGDDDTTVRQAGGPPPARDPAQRYEVSATVLENAEHGPELCLGGIAESYPIQCGGPPVVGWDWADADGEESVSGTTWGTYRLVGTWDGERFTLTGPPGPPVAPTDEGPAHDFSPACDAPEAVDPDAAAFEGVGEGEVPGLVALWVSDPAGDWDGPLVVSALARPGRGAEVEAAVRRTWAGHLCVVERDQPTVAELRAVQQEVSDAGSASPLGTVYVSYGDEVRGVVVVHVAVADDAARRWAAERWGDTVELVGYLQPVD